MAHRNYLLLVLVIIACRVKGQELDPRAYAALPVNMNAIALQTGVSRGNVLVDPSLPVDNLDVAFYSFGIGYMRTFDLAGKLARRWQVALPYASLNGKAEVNGKDTTGLRSGFGDIRMRFGISLIGSPPLDKKNFTQYTQETVVGISLVASMPTGLYHADKLINIGSNRWGFKPEVGISKRFKTVYLECYAGVWFYTNNSAYLGDKTLAQRPMGSVQFHGCYYFRNQMWLSLNGNWFSGGETLINDNMAGNTFDNWRVGGTWSIPIAKGQSLKLQFNKGAFTNRGYNYTSASLGYQCVFF